MTPYVIEKKWNCLSRENGPRSPFLACHALSRFIGAFIGPRPAVSSSRKIVKGLPDREYFLSGWLNFRIISENCEGTNIIKISVKKDLGSFLIV